MATRKEIESFLDAYVRSWSVEAGQRPAVFHAGGGVRYPGSDDLINPDTGPSMTDRIRGIAPDIQLRLLNWAEREDILFAEWELTCTLGGRPFRVEGVNRFTLQGSKALEATAFLDRLAMVEFADSTGVPSTIGSLLAAAFARAAPRNVSE